MRLRIEISQAKLQATERKLVKALAAKEKAVSLLDQVRSSRNKQKEKNVTAEECLKNTKRKNKALTKQLKTETMKSAETNHRAWLNNKANLTLLEETKNHIEASLKSNKTRLNNSYRMNVGRYKTTRRQTYHCQRKQKYPSKTTSSCTCS